jgi:uncharacterized protein YqgC (DUF456 family)
MAKDKAFEQQVNAMNQIANGNLGSNLKSTSKSHFQGALVGGIIGLVGALYMRKKPIYGIAIGSILGRLIVKKIK